MLGQASTGPRQELMGPGGRCNGAEPVPTQPIHPLCDVPVTMALAQRLSVTRHPEHDAGLKKNNELKGQNLPFSFVFVLGLDSSPLSEGILIVIVFISHPRCWFPCYSPFHTDARSEMDPLKHMHCNHSNRNAGLGLVFCSSRW